MNLKRLLLVRGAELVLFLALGAVPLAVHNPYALGLLTLLAIYGILLIGLDVSVGYLGQVNLAQAAFLGIGAYTAGDSSGQVGHIFNNTVDCSSDNGHCLAMDTKANALGTLYVENNIFISNGTTVCIASGTCKSIATLHEDHNYNVPTGMSTTEANSFGFTAASKYKPSSSDSHVSGQGLNLSSSCTGNLSGLCQDVSGAPWFGGSFIRGLAAQPRGI